MATNKFKFSNFSELPTENWNDIFGFLPRAQLAQIVPQIGDRHFASKAQFYLHKCGKITLGNLEISSKPKPSEDEDDENELEISSIPSEDEDGPIFNIPVVLKEGRELPLADVPIPANIKNFKQLRIRFIILFVIKSVDGSTTIDRFGHKLAFWQIMLFKIFDKKINIK
jgi:hypothetical protein